MNKISLFAIKTAVELLQFKINSMDCSSRLVLQLIKSRDEEAMKLAHANACQIDVDLGELAEIVNNLDSVLRGNEPEV